MFPKTLTPSEATIGNLCERVAAAARKSKISDERLQIALGIHGTGLEQAVLVALIDFVNKAAPAAAEAAIWKTLNLGTYKDAHDLQEAMKYYHVCSKSKDVMSKPEFKVSSEHATIDLVKVSLVDLGFILGYGDGATIVQICERALELGLSLCPPEVGPQLRLQYDDQPKWSWVNVGMEPITGSDGEPSIFKVGRSRDGDSHLSCFYGGPDYFWDTRNHPWVFARRKN